MRRSLIAAAAGTALLCLAPFGAATASARPSGTTPSSTDRIVVRPVTSSGHAVAGYRVTKIKDSSPIDCSFPSQSVAGVDDGILECSPDAAYAVACWRAAEAHHVLCLDDAKRKTLVRFRTSGKIARTTELEHRAPLTLELKNGVLCGIRDGGAGTNVKGHPTWDATYYCTHGKAVWASPTSHSYGIDRGGYFWTVEVANANGKHRVHRQKVTRAYFVGTA